MNNESIISIDLRNNPGFTHTYSRVVLEKLISNIQTLKQNKMDKENCPVNEDFERYFIENSEVNRVKSMKELNFS